ncbi:DLW-39 family protein [Brachybacterium sp. P6-10-X1]|uniref:DLW-39 family protein n=1 Tax=Brachybacterium sp. P6-10-X1 TaxID=1903186 RepID=UPI0012F732CD|nr:DLW-39 family protein [Brachybacterium sp. P6-10-X1]
MKKLISCTAVLIGSTVAGLLVWRKVESDRHRDELWSEAERVSAAQDAAEVRD